MCKTFGILSNWWSIVGIAVEVVGFIYLTQVAIRDIVGRFSEWLFALKGLEIDKISNKKDLEGAASLYLEVIVKPGARKLRTGGLIILVSLLLQAVGSWPC